MYIQSSKIIQARSVLLIIEINMYIFFFSSILHIQVWKNPIRRSTKVVKFHMNLLNIIYTISCKNIIPCGSRKLIAFLININSERQTQLVIENTKQSTSCCRERCSKKWSIVFLCMSSFALNCTKNLIQNVKKSFVFDNFGFFNISNISRCTKQAFHMLAYRA